MIRLVPLLLFPLAMGATVAVVAPIALRILTALYQ